MTTEILIFMTICMIAALIPMVVFIVICVQEAWRTRRWRINNAKLRAATLKR